jgi:NADPH:quinone reductase-like Zn-dependent oxidoreductase
MKAIVQEQYGSPDGLHLREIDKPEVGDGGVLARVRAASVNASDWHLLRRLPHLIGFFVLGKRPPRVRGGDVAGVVEAVGKHVTQFKPGDEVFGVAPGSFAEYVTASEDKLALKPRGLTFEQAAAMPGAGCTALQGLRDYGRVRPGQRVLIYGAGGGVGTFAVQIAKALGAYVTAVTHTASMDAIRSIGADEAIDYTKEDFTARGQRYDVLFDLGADRSYADCQRVLAPGGKVLLVGAPNGMWAVLARMLKLQSSPRPGAKQIAYLASVRHEELIALKDLAEAGKLTPVIDRCYPLEQAPDALRSIGTRHARGKIVITVA